MKTYERHASGRLFESDFLEAASKVHPATPMIFYVPVVVGLLVYSLTRGITTPAMAFVFFVLGYLTWCFMEYGLHRYFFHWEGNGPLTRRVHDIAHGYHHKYPDDPMRLVMPLGASIPLAILVIAILHAVGRPAATMPYFAGIVTGYLSYDLMHWYLHAKTPKNEWLKALRAHHMAHHFACPDKNFGISHRWVDFIVGSLRRR